ncbi:dihydrofolate reductase [Saccharomonospora amisosensis]|uniref:Dihydrofolate reductase n=1 Tax=Saccharomonospora amisosensis TaxID=1128677 RepID=A0A7X5UM33_9PSEU|nr:dihydrofolate reductase family protein [Saccharomonospora amisosensis]NIJ10184.1 dihydrofolate reductase [Saccharomonospora amisosensis]
MGSLFSFIATTVDGYHEGPDREIDWHNVDEEFTDFSLRQLAETTTLVFGRVTYEMMAAYWPTRQAGETDPEVAERMNTLPKVVISGTLTQAEWANTRVVSTGIAVEIAKLKQSSDGSIAVFGSAALTRWLLRKGLLDELRLMVMPVLLGAGHPVFDGGTGRIGLRLADSTAFASGNVLNTYLPQRIGLDE